MSDKKTSSQVKATATAPSLAGLPLDARRLGELMKHLETEAKRQPDAAAFAQAALKLLLEQK